MDDNTYVKNALRTSQLPAKVKFDTARKVQLVHAAMGLCTEAGEFMDALKKHIFYGAELDVVNLVEELGDLFWYMAIAAAEIDFSFEEIKQANIDKLKSRYPDNFSEKCALNRNPETEYKVLNDVYTHTPKFLAETTKEDE